MKKTDKVFGNINLGEFINTRGKLLLLLLLLAGSTLSFSQEVNYRRVENAKIIDINTGDTLSSHSSDIEAIQQLYNNKYQGGNVKMLGAVYEVDIKKLNCPEISETRAVDTITKVLFNYGNLRSKKRAVLDNCKDIYVLSKDSTLTIPMYSFTAKIARTFSMLEAKTTYRLISTPFFFYKSDSVYATSDSTVMKARTFANKTHCIRHFVNGVEIQGTALFNSIACNPGYSTYAGGSFRHTNTFSNLDRSIDNIIRLEALDVDTDIVIGSREFIIKKL